MKVFKCESEHTCVMILGLIQVRNLIERPPPEEAKFRFRGEKFFNVFVYSPLSQTQEFLRVVTRHVKFCHLISTVSCVQAGQSSSTS